MTTPSIRDVHVDAPLTNLAVAYMQKPMKFKANLLAPIVPVQKQSATYFIYDKGSLNRDDFARRTPGQKFARAGYNMSTSTYNCESWGLEQPLPDEIRKNFDSPLNADKSAIGHLMQKGLIRRERIFATEFMTTGLWSSDVAGIASGPSASQHVFWDNPNATIIEDLHERCDAIEKSTGYRPNRLAINADVWRVMKNDADIVDRCWKQYGGKTTLETIAALCGIGSEEEPGEIVVLRAIYNTAQEGASTSMDWVVGDKALLFYAASAPKIDEPSGLYTFSWSEFDGVKEAGAAAITTYREEQTKSDIYRGEMNLEMKVVASDLGVLFSDVLT